MALAVAVWAAPAAAENCAGLLAPHCLELLGAGAAALDRRQDCAAQLKRYRACLSDQAAGARRPDPQREDRAERAYSAVSGKGDPARLDLVAQRFPGTFWGDLAAREAAELRRRGGAARTPPTATASATAPAFAGAAPGPVADFDGVALAGYDPVAFFEQGRPVAGDARRALNWSGAAWYFSSDATMRAFQQNPGNYAPEYGGHCAYCLASGTLAKGAPVYWNVINNRLYVHSSKKNAERWQAEYRALRPKAEEEWRKTTGRLAAPTANAVGPFVVQYGLAIGGYDPVAYFTEGKSRRGDTQFLFSWGGADWSFVSLAHRDAFAANPTRYAPQYGGHCAYCLSGGSLRDGSPKYWDISGGLLYFHSTASNAKTWRRELAKRRAAADAQWKKLR